MPAWQVQHSVVADVTPLEAWGYWTNVENWRRLEGEAVESITLDGRFEAGTQGTTVVRNQPPRSWRLAQVMSPERAIIAMELPDAILSFAWRFEDLGDGRTRMTQQITLDGPSAEQYLQDVRTAFTSSIGPGMEKLALAMAQLR